MNDQLIKMPAPDPRYYFNVRPLSKSDMVVVREIWSENVYEVADGDFADTGIVIDIGANIGAFTLFAAKMGAKKVIAVEPEPHNIELLRMNIAENKKHSDCEFIVETDGIAGRSDSAFITDEHGDSRISDVKESGKSQINLITLDMLFGKYGLEYIDVLKIDIEGLEGDVLLHADKATLNLCRYITLEYDQHANDLGAIVEKLIQTHQIKAVGAHGGMIFAKRY
jgi:FkbM family methyltransferase